MNPPTETVPTVPQGDTLDVKIAVLTEKVNQVINDHERRISALETRRDNGATRAAAVAAPYIAGAGVIIAIVLQWKAP